MVLSVTMNVLITSTEIPQMKHCPCSPALSRWTGVTKMWARCGHDGAPPHLPRSRRQSESEPEPEPCSESESVSSWCSSRLGVMWEAIYAANRPQSAASTDVHCPVSLLMLSVIWWMRNTCCRVDGVLGREGRGGVGDREGKSGRQGGEEW